MQTSGLGESPRPVFRWKEPSSRPPVVKQFPRTSDRPDPCQRAEESLVSWENSKSGECYRSNDHKTSPLPRQPLVRQCFATQPESQGSAVPSVAHRVLPRSGAELSVSPNRQVSQRVSADFADPRDSKPPQLSLPEKTLQPARWSRLEVIPQWPDTCRPPPERLLGDGGAVRTCGTKPKTAIGR